MRNLIPHFIAEKFQNSQTCGNFMANTLFLDISGFTSMTERLMQEGKEGAEVLSEIINNIFEPVIETVYKSGGFITSFAGDAFTAVFPNIKQSAQVALCAVDIGWIFEKKGTLQTRFGEFNLFVKIGLSSGEVDWAIIGNQEQQTYYFKGEAIDGCAQSQQRCGKSDILFDEKFYLTLPKNIRTPKQCLYNGFYRLINCEFESEHNSFINKITIPGEVLEKFIPDQVLQLGQQGEFREIVVAFIAFKEPGEKEQLNRVIIKLIDKCNQYGGYFNRTLFGEKGGLLPICFGMPKSYENNLSRALDFALDLQKEFGSNIRIGLNSGIAFSGFVGSKLICEYTAYGDVVNLAVRLMTKAEWGKIWITEKSAQSEAKLFSFDNAGQKRFKGKSEPITVFELTGKNQDCDAAFFYGEMVGRSVELALLSKAAMPLFENKFAGIVTVYGDAGMGKSRLVYEFLKGHSESVELLFMQTDSVFKMSLNPFKYMLNNYFNQNKASDKEQKRAGFEAAFDLLIKNLNQSSDQRKISIINELERTKSILAAQVEIFYDNSLFEQLDAKGRFENSLFVYKEFIKALSLLKPVIISIEDIHWLDDDSQVMLKTLCRSVDDFPIMIIATSRFNDDGSKPVLTVDSEVLQQEIELTNLDSDSAVALINMHLDNQADSALVKFINDKAEFNPFYIEQIIYYLKENNQLEQNSGKTSLTAHDLKIPETINAIIVARIDRLETNHKSVVQLACVLGREVELDIFYDMLKLYKSILKRKELNLILEKIEDEQLWNKFTEVKYIFKHALLHEAVYEMQLKSKLRDLHNIAALAIEKNHPDNEERFYEIAYHFDKAEIIDKSVNYYKKAGDWLQTRYYNLEAIKCYDKVLEFLDESGDASSRIDTLGKKGSILQLIGKWDEAEACYQKAFDLSKKISDTVKTINFQCNIAWIRSDKGDKNSAMQLYRQSLALANEVEDNKKCLSRVYGQLGVMYRNQNNYDEAMQCYQKQIEIADKFGYKEDLALAKANMANIYQDQGNYEEAMNCCRISLSLFEELNRKQSISKVVGNMGNVYFFQNDYSNAMACYKKNLQIAEELGDRHNSSIAITNIGLICRVQGDSVEAMKCYQKHLQTAQELGDKRGVLLSIRNMSNVYLDIGDYTNAMECCQKQLKIADELGDKRAIAVCFGTTGLIYSENREYARALECYDKAISLGYELSFKYSLCEVLYLKAQLLNTLKDYEKARILNREALEIAEDIKRSDIIFNSTILSHKLLALENPVEAVANLILMLETETEDENLAAVHYEIFKINQSAEHGQKALATYRELYSKTPNIEYKNRISELKGDDHA